ncbi:MAG: DUF2752 domain-containing protein [Thermoanaerobaculia bacterium]|nr:DUF2752 domain-containing protein [Thermoanaerobaculia bacterium]
MGALPPRAAAFLACAGIACIAVLFFFDPATAGFYPACLFKTVLGAPCPGCGSLRAAHQLLHGNVAAAWALNRTVLVAVPLAAAVTLFTFLRSSSSFSSSSRPPT